MAPSCKGTLLNILGYIKDCQSLGKLTKYRLIFERQIRYQPTWSGYQKEPIDYSNYQNCCYSTLGSGNMLPRYLQPASTGVETLQHIELRTTLLCGFKSSQ